MGAGLDQAARSVPVCRLWALASGIWTPDLRAVICPPNAVLFHLPLGLSQPPPAPPKQLSTPTSTCTLGSPACHPPGLQVGRAGKAGQKGGGGAWEVLGAWGHLQKPRVLGQRLWGQRGTCRGPSRGRLAQSGFVVRSSVSFSPETVSRAPGSSLLPQDPPTGAGSPGPLPFSHPAGRSRPRLVDPTHGLLVGCLRGPQVSLCQATFCLQNPQEKELVTPASQVGAV